MTVLENTITTEQMIDGLNIDMVQRFDQGMDPLLELLDEIEVEIIAAGTTIEQHKVVGELNKTKVAEGDETPLSQYALEPIPVGTISLEPYRKLTTASSILKSGYVKAVGKTDRKMINQVRTLRVNDFYSYLANGTTKTSGKTMQAALIYSDTALRAKLAKAGDSTDRIFHYVNSFDVADYLAEHKITTETVSGMEYLKTFLGVSDVFISPDVAQGSTYATPIENIHIYGIDFAELAKAGLVYETSDKGLIGVAHKANMERNSCETFVISGMLMIADVVDYIVVATIGDGTEPAIISNETSGIPAATPEDQSDAGNSGETAFDPTGDVLPTMANTADEITAFAEAHEISLKGATNKTQQLEKIHAALV